jgi:hypothetical protein
MNHPRRGNDIPVPGVEPGSARSLEFNISNLKTSDDSRYTIPEMITPLVYEFKYAFLLPELT